MKDKLTKEEVEHVAHLARIEIDEEEISMYQVKLKQLMDGIEKINEVIVNDEDILITPITHNTLLRNDSKEEMLEVNEVLKNVPNKSGNFIKVPVIINE